MYYQKSDFDSSDYLALYAINDKGKNIFKGIVLLKKIQLKSKNLYCIEPSKIQSSRLYMFFFENLKFIYDFSNKTFEQLPFYPGNISGYRELDEEQVEDHLNIFGKCNLDIEIKNFFSLFISELSDPFYLFQIFAFILWFNLDYQTYALLILVLTVISLIVSVKEIRSNLFNIKRLVADHNSVTIQRRNNVLFQLLR